MRRREQRASAQVLWGWEGTLVLHGWSGWLSILCTELLVASRGQLCMLAGTGQDTTEVVSPPSHGGFQRHVCCWCTRSKRWSHGRTSRDLPCTRNSGWHPSTEKHSRLTLAIIFKG